MITATTTSRRNTRNYYVAEAGTGRGLSELDPMSPASFSTMVPGIGSTVFFNRGDEFEIGDIVINNANVTITAYGSGADPILYGSTSLTAATWTSETGGYYSTPLTSAPLWVFKNGVEARQGESDWIQITSSSGNVRVASSVTLNAFNTVQSLAGAKFRGKEFPFRLSYENEIVHYNTTTGAFTMRDSNTGFAADSGFKLYGQKQFATLEGDWWYEESTGKLWIKTVATPAGTNIRVCTKSYAFNVVSASDVTIDGLEFAHYYRAAVRTFRATNFEIINFYIHDCRTYGMWITGNSTGLNFDAGEIERIGLNAIFLGAISSSTFTALEIHEIGMASNYGWPIDSTLKSGGVGIAFFSDTPETTKMAASLTMENLLIYNVGYQGIAPYGPNHIFREAVIHDYCLRWDDGGGIHPFYRSDLGPGESTDNGTIEDCFIYDGIGSHDGLYNYTTSTVASVYLDNGTENWLVDNCTLYNNTFAGVFANSGTEQTRIYNCHIYNNGAQVRFYENEELSGTIGAVAHNYKNELHNNVLISGQGQFAIWTLSTGSTANPSYNPYSSGGTADNNIYITPNQISSDLDLFNHQTVSTVTGYTLAEWITRNGRDAASTSRGFYLDSSAPTLGYDQVVINGNTSDVPVFYDLPDGVYTDEDDVDIDDMTVPAWTAGVGLVRPEYYYLMDSFLGTAGSSMSGRTPKIGNNAQMLSGTHTINASNEMVTSSPGLVLWDVGHADLVFELLGQASNTSTSFRMDIRYATNTTSTTNRIIIDHSAGNVRVRESTGGGGLTTLTSGVSTAYTMSVGFHRMAVVASGSSIKVYMGGVLKFDTTTTILTGNFISLFGETTRVTDFVVVYPPQP
jgi:hypothetical protein